MTNLENKFFDKYKECDSFIRDAYKSSTGVSEYIDRMDTKAHIGSYRVPGWDDDYKSLKHYRWVRNQLAHNASVVAGICNEADYKWLCSFYSRLLHADDPLARLHKLQSAAKQKRPQVQNNTRPQPSQVYASRQSMPQKTKAETIKKPAAPKRKPHRLLKFISWLMVFVIIILAIAIIRLYFGF